MPERRVWCIVWVYIGESGPTETVWYFQVTDIGLDISGIANVIAN